MAGEGAALALPRGNPDLLGHDSAERTLLDAWNSGRLPHAWLIGGVPGIGKATLAYRFARFVLAQGAGTGEAGLFGAPRPPASLAIAASDPTFARVASGGHGDLLTVERPMDEKKGRLKRDIPVDEVRRIAPFLRLTAAEGGWRVVVLDGAERLNPAGQNAILKILEEPPARALLLVVTENPGGLLPTIRSRCRKLALSPLSEAVVLDLLARARPDIGDADRHALAGLAEGSIGRAIELAEAGGLDLYRDMVGLFGQAPRIDMVAAHGFADRLARRGNEAAYEVAAELMVWWLARLVRALARGEVPAPVVPGETEVASRLVGERGLERWVEVWEKVTRLFTRAEAANLDRKQVVLNALLTLEAAAAA
ncbi:DNA polymerase III subunit delta' [Arenibaculum pallidiluteum]|uniref:DNA polymerase III subunit delta' n=1 Tax=Arenibaculum pallidiluteum TaxID=2812559 RepID=UPI001A96D3ED|nr:DNA polymerase III subunit delta' [Arenibaculum pallidiluteum]